MKPITRLLIALALPMLALVLPAFATTDSVITVCVSGPPTCDTASIQAAIDAANFGDTVVVSAGTYTEQLTLKSGITLTSTDGPTSTIVMATSGPIVLAEAVTATQFSGFTVDGSAILTPAIGLSIIDSDFTFANSHIQHLHGFTGTGLINGEDAIGLSITGTFNVTIEQVAITDISGGQSGWSNGGSATGIAANGDGHLIISATQISTLTGGDPPQDGYGPYYCYHAGGDSIGISKQGNTTLSLSDTSITQLTGGRPCRALSWYCVFYAGQAIGVHAVSGTLEVQNTTIADLTWWAGNRGYPLMPVASYGIRSQAMDITHIQHTRILSLTAIPEKPPARSSNQPTSPSCSPPPGNGIGISLEDGQSASVDNTVVGGVIGAGTAGLSVGIQSRNTATITLAQNQLTQLHSGSLWPPTSMPQSAGIIVDTAQFAEIANNQIDHIHGGQGELLSYGFVNYGANATGLYMNSITAVSVLNNLVFAVAGGDGAYNQSPWPQEFAGAGTGRGLQIERSTSQVQSNTLYDVRAGVAGYPVGQPGQGIGIELGSDTTVLALNNAIISSTVGVSATANNYLWDYNTLWQTDLNYSGIVTGPHDLHADPRFIDATHGDFRLSFNSPLIDAGFNVFAPANDFAGNPRPIDGDGDGLAITDIGAYEYQPVPLQHCYLPVITYHSGQ